MDQYRFTYGITSFANLISNSLSDDDLALLIVILSQLGGTLETIFAQRELQEKLHNKNKEIDPIIPFI